MERGDLCRLRWELLGCGLSRNLLVRANLTAPGLLQWSSCERRLSFVYEQRKVLRNMHVFPIIEQFYNWFAIPFAKSSAWMDNPFSCEGSYVFQSFAPRPQ